MIHSKTITTKEQENLKPYLFVKANADFKQNDLIILSIQDEETKKMTGEQLFFNVEKVTDKTTDKNIKAGTLFLNIKRVKNPLTIISEDAIAKVG